MKPPTSSVKVLFLDRDGTINVDMGKGYLTRPEDARLIEGSGRAIVRAQTAGFKIAIITNQAGVAKGLIPIENIPLIHSRLEKMIAAEAGVKSFKFDDIRFCPHHPDEKCLCRKPGTRMVEESAKALGADLKSSYFAGDNVTDLQCGERAGLKTILVRTGHGKTTESELPATKACPSIIADSLLDAVELVLSPALLTSAQDQDSL